MNSQHPQFILASSSLRRKELLGQLGYRFIIRVASIDEQPLRDERAEEYVLRLASGKAGAVVQQSVEESCSLPVLGADTTVVIDGEILGKPESRSAAIDMLTRLSGRTHEVLTGIALAADDEVMTAISRSLVTFMPLSSTIIDQYWKSGESMGKAGGYAIQGLAGGWVSDLKGSYSGVVGLPLYETGQLLQSKGIDWL
ncbi:MAG: Maf family protein [Arenicellales bacterium]|nr:Maf family protein [Arenicellales bacterium]